jgi:hypothetical protein
MWRSLPDHHRGRRPASSWLLAGFMLVSAAWETGAAASLPVQSGGILIVRTCDLAGSPPTTTSEADAYVDSFLTTTNFGLAPTVNVASGSTLLFAPIRRGYVRFDLGACSPRIPATATILAATLRLFVTSIASTCRTYDLFEATAPWSETTITWANQPAGTSPNVPPSTSRIASISIGSGAGCTVQQTGTVVSLPVTSSVAAFVAGLRQNNGWLLRDDQEAPLLTSAETDFAAKEMGVAAEAPELVVTYR